MCYRWTWDRKQVSPTMCFCHPRFPSVVLPNLAWSGRELWWVYSILCKVGWKTSVGLSRCAPVLPRALNPGCWPLKRASLASFSLSYSCDFGKRSETGKKIIRSFFSLGFLLQGPCRQLWVWKCKAPMGGPASHLSLHRSLTAPPPPHFRHRLITASAIAQSGDYAIPWVPLCPQSKEIVPL